MDNIEYQLSDKDILKIIKHPAKTITYPELINYGSIDLLFGKYHIILLLYVNNEDEGDIEGHWCLLTLVNRNGNKICEFLDPYGYFPDDELCFYSAKWREESGQDKKLLTKLLYDFSLIPNHKIYYNEVPFQKESATINTCGRWIAIRGHFYKVPLEEFQKYFKQLKKDGWNLDKLSVCISNLLSK